MIRMYTSEGKKLDTNHPRPDYPTPQFARDSFLSLNGPWDFAIDEDADGNLRVATTVVVPFAVETILSGLERKAAKGQIMHYRKKVTLPEGFNKGRVLIHFEAVDQVCDVYLNGVHIAHHEGGYLPFTADCMELVPGENTIQVDVVDDTDSPLFPRGKQSSKPKGIWYTSTSGIWGDVWMESVPHQVIQSLKIVPLFDEKKVRVQVRFEGKIVTSRVVVRANEKELAVGELDENACCELELSSYFYAWSPERPFLYGLSVEVNQDKVKSYFAMRKFSVMEHHGHPVFALNNKPYFLKGVLDQGYYPDGGLTAPSDYAMASDLRTLKEMGFNMVRKHIKIEPMRWYYHCDHLGLIVIQDFVNLGEMVKSRLFLLAPFFHLNVDDERKHQLLGVGDSKARDRFVSLMPATVERLFNVPSIAIWTLFNEGWGQFDSVRLTKYLKELDPTRLVDSTSGWFDQGAGDFDSRHIYFKKANPTGDGRRILSISECGAYSLLCEGHYEQKKKTLYRYYRDSVALTTAIEKLYEKQLAPLLERGLSAMVYTQLSDVEGETNGLVTYDRKVTKVDPRVMRRLNNLLTFKGENDD